MKRFLVVLKYELKEYFTSKGFMVTTILIGLIGAILLSLPRVIDLSEFTGVEVVAQQKKEDNKEEQEEKDKLYLVDKIGLTNQAILEEYFPDSEWIMAESEETLKEAVQNQEAEAGFVIQSEDSYDYYLYNRGLDDEISDQFDEAMQIFYRQAYCEANELDYQQIEEMYEADIHVNEQILNKDTRQNYFYCYILVILVFMMIIMYGQSIAISVTNEKSNRSIEVLVTSTTPNSLLFGKVMAGAISSLLQVGYILGCILISYQFNREQWGGMLDMVFKIPSEVLITFAFFGLGGFLFYAFLYGAMGAMVSKTEDVSKSSGGLMTMVMIVYGVSMALLSNVDSIVGKVFSFLPFSSYSVMFMRIAMGTVEIWEVIVSFVILLVSIIGAGLLSAKLYRLGTLRYGNPIKLRTALKGIRKVD